MVIKPTMFSESVLKSARMPVLGSASRAEKLETRAVDKFYNLLSDDISGTNEIRADKIFHLLKKVFPNISIKLKNMKCVQDNSKADLLAGFSAPPRALVLITANRNMQVYKYRLFLGLDNNMFKIDAKSMEEIIHESTHISTDAHNPPKTAATVGFYRNAARKIFPFGEIDVSKSRKIGLKSAEYDQIYVKTLYNNELDKNSYLAFKENFQKGGIAKIEAIAKRIAQVKAMYVSQLKSIIPLVEGEKIQIIKNHLRRLESERKAHKLGVEYSVRFQFEQKVKERMMNDPEYSSLFKGEATKPSAWRRAIDSYCEKADIADCQPFINMKDENNHKIYIFPEKIQMLKEMFFDEVKKERQAHFEKLVNRSQIVNN